MGFLGWVILGVIFSIGAVKLFSWAGDKGYKIKWYEVLLMVLGAVAIIFAIEAFIGNLREFEPTAANMSLVFMGLPGVLLIAIGAGLIYKNLTKMSA